MKLKKINAALGLLSIVFMLLHMGYTVYAYLAFYYNPFLKNLFAVPFMVLVCLHAVLGMMTVFSWISTRRKIWERSCRGFPRLLFSRC